jgi:hypothetical protein
MLMDVGGNGYGLWIILVGYFGLCILFPDCAVCKFIVKVMDKLMCGGGRQRW